MAYIEMFHPPIVDGTMSNVHYAPRTPETEIRTISCTVKPSQCYETELMKVEKQYKKLCQQGFIRMAEDDEQEYLDTIRGLNPNSSAQMVFYRNGTLPNRDRRPSSHNSSEVPSYKQSTIGNQPFLCGVASAIEMTPFLQCMCRFQY